MTARSGCAQHLPGRDLRVRAARDGGRSTRRRGGYAGRTSRGARSRHPPRRCNCVRGGRRYLTCALPSRFCSTQPAGTCCNLPRDPSWSDILHPDATGCIVLDVQMPGMTGPELHDRMSERGVDLPVVYLTAHADIPASVQAMKKGAVDFLLKPVERRHSPGRDPTRPRAACCRQGRGWRARGDRGALAPPLAARAYRHGTGGPGTREQAYRQSISASRRIR